MYVQLVISVRNKDIYIKPYENSYGKNNLHEKAKVKQIQAGSTTI